MLNLRMIVIEITSKSNLYKKKTKIYKSIYFKNLNNNNTIHKKYLKSTLTV